MELVSTVPRPALSKQDDSYVGRSISKYDRLLRSLEETISDALKGGQACHDALYDPDLTAAQVLAAAQETVMTIQHVLEAIVHSWAFKAAPEAANLLRRVLKLRKAMDQLATQI